jgi:uncharacterized membrane protein
LICGALNFLLLAALSLIGLFGGMPVAVEVFLLGHGAFLQVSLYAVILALLLAASRLSVWTRRLSGGAQRVSS